MKSTESVRAFVSSASGRVTLHRRPGRTSNCCLLETKPRGSTWPVPIRSPLATRRTQGPPNARGRRTQRPSGGRRDEPRDGRLKRDGPAPSNETKPTRRLNRRLFEITTWGEIRPPDPFPIRSAEPAKAGRTRRTQGARPGAGRTQRARIAPHETNPRSPPQRCERASAPFWAERSMPTIRPLGRARSTRTGEAVSANPRLPRVSKASTRRKKRGGVLGGTVQT